METTRARTWKHRIGAARLGKGARAALVGTGWVAVVTLGGVSFLPTPQAVAAGITQTSYVLTSASAQASATAETSEPLRRPA